ncbi:hypothetical protein Taro_031017 [Colocasia esculenta]|uniref:Uncharacterized protein n=1 Tax=Colocasia esculenta TaxID=4460 RepID=A0A843VVJ6_COLES|nr:hypothetical protein [Colocasia esculenta]
MTIWNQWAASLVITSRTLWPLLKGGKVKVPTFLVPATQKLESINSVMRKRKEIRIRRMQGRRQHAGGLGGSTSHLNEINIFGGFKK